MDDEDEDEGELTLVDQGIDLNDEEWQPSHDGDYRGSKSKKIQEEPRESKTTKTICHW